MITNIKNRVKSALNERGAVAFEYVLLIGGVSAVIVLAIVAGAPGLMGAVLDGACTAIDLVVDIGLTDCTP